MVMMDISNMQSRVREMVKAGQTGVEKLYDISDDKQHKMLKVYKEVCG